MTRPWRTKREQASFKPGARGSTNRVASAIASVAALWLATGAWAFYWELDVKEPVTYAEEIFGGANPGNPDLALAGDDTNTTNGRQPTRVELQLVLPDQTNVENGAQAEVTFTISGAVFVASVYWDRRSQRVRLNT